MISTPSHPTPAHRTSRRLARLVGLLTATLVALGLVAAVPTSAVAKPVRGSDGIGDPYFPLDGNGGYDVLRYGIKVRYAPAKSVIEGNTLVKLRATRALKSLNLDLLLKVTEVRVNGRRAEFRKPHKHELRVHLKPR
ncbi:MAG: hypothetical protein WAW88_11345, partial [Nocardioides sp.]